MNDRAIISAKPGFPWRWFLLGVILLLILVAATFWWWLNSSCDLDSFASEAKAAGVDLDPVKIDPLADAWWQGLEAAAQGIPSFNLEQPSPQTLAAINQPRYLRLLPALDAFPTGAAGKVVALPSGLNALLRAQILTRPTAELPRTLQRLQRLAVAGTASVERSWTWSPNLYYGVADCVALRLREIPAAQRKPVADALTALATEVMRGFTAGMARHIREYYRRAATPPGDISRASALVIPQLYEHLPGGLGYRLLDRAGRGLVLERLLGWYSATARCHEPRGYIDLALPDIADMKSADPALWPTHWLAHLMHQGFYLEGVAETMLHLRLLAAELNGHPWPEDPFAPPGTPLHRVERDGALLGAWSVGEDGVADGGDRSRDCCLSLGGRLGRPNMGDALPAKP